MNEKMSKKNDKCQNKTTNELQLFVCLSVHSLVRKVFIIFFRFVITYK